MAAATHYALVLKSASGFLVTTTPFHMTQSGTSAVTKQPSEPKGNVCRITIPKRFIFGVWSGVCDPFVKAPESWEVLFEVGEKLWRERAA